MYKIGIIGHSPEHFGAEEAYVRRVLGRTIDSLGFQYGESDVVFNIVGDIGVGLWSAEECLDREYKFHLFLPYPVEETSQHWYDSQKDHLRKCYGRAFSITTCYQDTSWTDRSYELLVDDSNFIVCFWTGRGDGKTYDAIKYALHKNKLALSGFDDLKLVTNEILKRKDFKWNEKK